jgi:hypothetical protein
MSNRIDYLTPERMADEKPIWIDPVGGLGDILMLSTAMKRAFDKYDKKFHLSRRTHYTQFFIGHPAVAEIGNPPVDADIVCNDYWSRPEFNDLSNKALTILLKIFAITGSDDESLFLPEIEPDEATKLLLKNIPWGKKNVAIAFSSESPRKMMHPFKWHIIVEKLLDQRCFVVQLGGARDINIHGAYSLLGVTTPRQVCEIVKHVDLVITPDNFIMHAAQLAGKPAIALFGPTEPERYGYKNHICIRADKRKCEFVDKCLGPHVPDNYATPCPLKEDQCMNNIDENKIVDIAMTILNR